MRAYAGGHLGEYADDLMPLLTLQLAYAVVGFHHLGRFYEDGTSRGALVVYDTGDLAF